MSEGLGLFLGQGKRARGSLRLGEPCVAKGKHYAW